MAELPRGTITFLFTDLEGSTQLLQRLGRRRYGHLLDEHRRVLTDAIDAHAGRVVDTQGEGFFIAFPRAKDAVDAAVDAQRSFHDSPWEGIELRVRMGLHTGETEIDDGRYVGIAVVRAQRICAAGHGGQILLSSTTSDVVSDDLPNGTRLRDVGKHRLKGLARPERLTQLVGRGLTEETRRPRHEKRLDWNHLNTRRRATVVGGTAAFTAIVAVAVAIALTRGSSGPTLDRIDLNSLGVIDPARNALAGEVRTGLQPTRIAVGDSMIWVANSRDRTLSRIDRRALRLASNIPLDYRPADVAVLGDTAWVVAARASTNVRTPLPISRVDVDADYVAKTISVAGVAAQATAAASGFEGIWIAAGSKLARIDPETNTVTTIEVDRAIDVATGEDAVWIINGSVQGATDTGSVGTLWQVNPATNAVATKTPVGRDVIAVTTGEGAVWVLREGAVVRVDPETGVIAGTIPLPPSAIATDIAAGSGGVWVANGAATGPAVYRIDPNSNQLAKTIELGNRPEGIAVGAGEVWVTVY